jgi:hypothetical protein
MRFPVAEIAGEVGAWFGRLWQRTRSSPSALVLVVSNLAAAVVALAHPPVSISLLFVYWFECVIIGAINVVKLYCIPATLGPAADTHPVVRLLLVAFGRTVVALVFVVHYGIFTAVIGGVILGLGDVGGDIRTLADIPIGRYMAEFAWPIAFLGAAHVRSFFVQFIGKKEYRGRKLDDQMFRPYRRMLLMFGMLWAGVFIVVVTHQPALIALVFVPAKIVADLVAHFRDHRAGGGE